MDLGQLTFIALAVVTIVGALKDAFPTMTGNVTRLTALIIGAILGLIAQVHLLPGVDATIVTGAMSGVAAIGGVTLLDRVGANS